MPARIDITGQKFNRLTAIKRVEGQSWLFKCDCGNEIIQPSASIKCGNSKSCGCLNIERLVERNTKHGMGDHPLYQLWQGMRARCRYPHHIGFKNYGAKGITVCARWDNFEAFVDDMGPRPKGYTLERKRTADNYEPDNCIWATPQQQSENTSRNRYLELESVRLTVSQWARKLGINQKTLNKRRYLGWSDERVLTTSVGERL